MEEGKGLSDHGGDAAAVTGPHVSRGWEQDMARKISASSWDFTG